MMRDDLSKGQREDPELGRQPQSAWWQKTPAPMPVAPMVGLPMDH